MQEQILKIEHFHTSTGTRQGNFVHLASAVRTYIKNMYSTR